MVETCVLIAFCVLLVVCFSTGVSLTLSLFFGLLLFSGYVVFIQKRSFRELVDMIRSGIGDVKSCLPIFFMIGLLTGLWRACGTITTIITYVVGLIHPAIFLMLTFLLCGMLSLLTGTAFGSVATMGVICASIGNAMGIPMLFMGGAVLSGAFFGDRCSPVSSSALVVSELTDTNIYDNVKLMVKTGLMPFLIVCAIYLGIGFALPRGEVNMDVAALFAREFTAHYAALIPAAIIIVFALLRINVKYAMGASIISAAVLCAVLQHHSLATIALTALRGFKANDPEVAAMVNGGGFTSMIDVILVLYIAAAYGGIFQNTDLLGSIERMLVKVHKRFGFFAALFVAAFSSCLIACDQMLAVMMTNQLGKKLAPDKHTLAIGIENTSIVLSPLIPWAIGCRVPMAIIGAPRAAVGFACFLYVLPLYTLITSVIRFKRTGKESILK